MDPHLYGQLIFGKAGKNTQWKKVSSTNSDGKTGWLTCRRMKPYHLFFFNVCFWERQNVSGGGAEREEDTESKAGSRLWAVSTEPDAGLEPTNCEIMTWAKVRCLTDWATQEPLSILNIPVQRDSVLLSPMYNLQACLLVAWGWGEGTGFLTIPWAGDQSVPSLR